MDITVAICTYNGAERLPLVLNYLKSQILSPEVSWEIVVVNNNSCDQTTQVVGLYQDNSRLGQRLRYASEARQGLAYARRRAVQLAKGKLVAFLDDDNLPDSRWLQAVFDFGQQHPTAGAYGSKIAGRYETPPPPDFERIACFLAIIDRGDRPFRYDQLQHWLFPAGAGLVVRRQAWLASVPAQPALTGVKAQQLSGKGEDIETLSYLRKDGWQIWHNPAMQIEHVVGCDRLTSSYLLKLFRGVGLSRHHTRTIRFKQWQKPVAVCAYVLRDLSRLLVYSVRHWHHRSAIVNQCELTLLRYSLLSPIYHVVQQFQKKVSFVRHRTTVSTDCVNASTYLSSINIDSS